jgi:two-component system cell cycle response regulator DivK
LFQNRPMDRRHSRNPPARPLVLLVEGHEDTRAMYALVLSANGFDVVPARDGAEAYRRAWLIHPDVIVADVPIPNVDGWPFFQDLKGNPRTRDIPVVAMSGYVRRSVRDGAARNGFAAYFSKPCLPDELIAGLRQVLGCAA